MFQIVKTFLKKIGFDGTAKADEVLAKEKKHIEEEFADQFDSNFRDYLNSDYKAFVRQAYPKYVREHYPYIDPEAYPHSKRPWYGLALSGGGIRSASFAIGVIQGLHNKQFFDKKPTVMDRVTYLSTVSGGGYTGSALSWYQKIYNLFPFGNIKTFSGSQYSHEPQDQVLSYIRQHGKYLTPAQLGISSLIGAILMSILYSIVAYTLLFSLVMFLLQMVASSETVASLLNTYIVNGTSLRHLLEWLPSSIASMQNEQIHHGKIAFSAFFLSISLILIAAFVATVFFYGFSSFLRYYFSMSYCYRVKIQALLGRLLKLIAASLSFAALPLVVIFVFGEELTATDPGLFSSLISGLVSIILAIRNFRQEAERSIDGKGIIGKLMTGLSTLVFIFFILLISYLIGEAMYKTVMANQDLLWPIALIFAALIIPVFVNINQISPHKMYRDRLMETFLKAPETSPTAPICERGREADKTLLSEMEAKGNWSPYHLINCNIILNNATTPRFRGRVGDSFLLSPLYCGSDATDYIATDRFAGGQMTLATAMSISGAAENPHSGVSGEGKSINPFVAFLLTFLGLRLGYWTFNPATSLRKLNSIMRPNYIFPGLYSLLNFGHAEKSMFIELSDGGHFDNTGIYELVRRRTPVIILADGSADPDFTFDDLGNAIERIRVDFGVLIRFPDVTFDLSGLLPGSQASVSQNSAKIYDEKYSLSERGYAIGDIIYPDIPNEKGFIGRFVYIKATLTRNLPGDLYAYKASHPSYPNQSTLDQFFDERQFESYRELGYQLTSQLFKNEQARKQIP